MGTVKWTSIPDERPPYGWNLDFLTLPERKIVLDSLDFFVRTIKGAAVLLTSEDYTDGDAE